MQKNRYSPNAVPSSARRTKLRLRLFATRCRPIYTATEQRPPTTKNRSPETCGSFYRATFSPPHATGGVGAPGGALADLAPAERLPARRPLYRASFGCFSSRSSSPATMRFHHRRQQQQQPSTQATVRRERGAT